jgi:hypothetical protein
MSSLPALSRHSEKDLERIALEALRDCDLAPEKVRPVPIDLLVERRFGFNETYAALAPGILGEIHFGPAGPLEIRLAKGLDDLGDSALDIPRRRVLAHECAHGLVHGPAFARAIQRQAAPSLPGLGASPARISCREAAFVENRAAFRSLDDPEALLEWEADRVMDPLLAPAPAVRALLRPLLTGADDGYTGRHLPAGRHAVAVRLLVERFEIPRDVAERRLQQLFPLPLVDLFTVPPRSPQVPLSTCTPPPADADPEEIPAGENHKKTKTAL